MPEKIDPNTTHILRLPWSDLHPASYNRPDRSGFDKKSLGELADSIREQGILLPLTVRKNPHGKGWEIIAGERRWTAAGQVNKKMELPCLNRVATDAEAMEVNAIENLQRVGLHPVEEARGYQSLLDLPADKRYTIERISQRLGKSVAFVYARLKLLKAPPLALKASFSGKLSHSHLLLVARIPDPKLAHKATIELLSPITRTEEAALDPEVDPMSYRQAKAHVRNHYMVSLKEAPFDPEDKDLVPVHWEVKSPDNMPDRKGAGPIIQIVTSEPPNDPACTVTRLHGGACSDCPFRTGNMKALFPDVESADVCTNPTCYKKKKDADWKREQAKAAEEGDTLLKPKEAANLFNPDGSVYVGANLIDLDDTFPGEKRKTWESMLGEHVPANCVRAKDSTGKLHVLLPLDQAIEAARAAGHTKAVKKLTKSDQAETMEQANHRRQEEQAAREARQATLEVAASEAIIQIRKQAAKAKPNKKFWLLLAGGVFESVAGQRHGIKNDKHAAQFLKKQNEANLRALIIESVFCTNTVTWQGKFYEGFERVAKHFKVDLQKLLKAAPPVNEPAEAEAK